MEITKCKECQWSESGWCDLYGCAEPLSGEPSNEWKDKIIRAEHSPIRLVEFDIWLEDIPAFIAGHLVRHHQGIEKFHALIEKIGAM